MDGKISLFYDPWAETLWAVFSAQYYVRAGCHIYNWSFASYIAIQVKSYFCVRLSITVIYISRKVCITTAVKMTNLYHFQLLLSLPNHKPLYGRNLHRLIISCIVSFIVAVVPYTFFVFHMIYAWCLIADTEIKKGRDKATKPLITISVIFKNCISEFCANKPVV